MANDIVDFNAYRSLVDASHVVKELFYTPT